LKNIPWNIPQKSERLMKPKKVPGNILNAVPMPVSSGGSFTVHSRSQAKLMISRPICFISANNSIAATSVASV
jgi:hypothetical protein